MKILIDFFPILLFFGAYKLHAVFGVGKDEAIYFATPVLMGATALQMAIIYAIDRKLTTLHKSTLALVFVFGSITLAIHDKRYIMWKPTVLYIGVACAMAVAIWGLKKNLSKTLLGSNLELPGQVWHRLGVARVSFIAFLAISNAYVVLYYSEEAWIDFKIWGYGFWLIFFIGQAFLIAPHIKADEVTEEKTNS